MIFVKRLRDYGTWLNDDICQKITVHGFRFLQVIHLSSMI